MELSTEDLENFAVNRVRPIAGQSLTNSPDSAAPYERPPKFTSKDEALDYFFEYITNEVRYPEFIEILEEGVPVMDVVQLVLTKSFQEGDINPDLMMLLAEPMAYIFLGLAEKEGVRATIVEDDDDPEIVAGNAELAEYNSPFEDTDLFKEKLQAIKNPKDDVDNPTQEKINALPSLMGKGKKNGE